MSRTRRRTLEDVCRELLDVLDAAPQPLSLGQLGQALPGPARSTIRRALGELARRGEVTSRVLWIQHTRRGVYRATAFYRPAPEE